MSKKEPISFSNIREGQLLEDTNAAITDAVKRLQASDNSKDAATVTVKISIKKEGKDGLFAKVSSSIGVSAPAIKTEQLLGIQHVDGESMIVTEPVLPARPVDQTQLPGIVQMPKAANS